MEPNHNNNQQQANNRKQLLAKYAKYSAFAFQMIGLFVGLSLGGNWLDKHWNFSFPFLTLTGVTIALVGSFYALFSIVKEDDQK